MCAACVAQGITYVGGAVGGLQVLRARARARTRRLGKATRVDAEAVDAERAADGAADDTATTVRVEALAMD
jgi:hypothetical protein